MNTKIQKRIGMTLILSAITAGVAGCNSNDNDTNNANTFEKPTSYAGFPVRLKGAEGENSTSYKGQMARHVLRESLKETLKSPMSSGTAAILNEAKQYFENPDNIVDAAEILSPVSKDAFKIKEKFNNELGTGKNLSGKLFNPEKAGDPLSGVTVAESASVMGWPGKQTPKGLVESWLKAFAEDHGNNSDGEADYYDMKHGYDYRQLVSKYLMGAVFYNQSVDKYLDENLVAGTKDNDAPYKDGAIYTGKEHSWDEGFGYFGAAANYSELTAKQNYEVAKKGKSITQAEALALADINNDGLVSLYTEYTYGPAYYAASFDKDGKSNYGKDIVNGFIEGRTIIANAVDSDGYARKLNDSERQALQAIASKIQRNWEAVYAEAVYKYAGQTYSDISSLEDGTSSNPKKYYHHWGELKGFILALQYGGANSLMTKADFKEIDDLIGYGPVMPNGNQVNGIDASGNYTMSSANSLATYKSNMMTIQQKLDTLYGLKAKQREITQ